jgi:hypothetical protein
MYSSLCDFIGSHHSGSDFLPMCIVSSGLGVGRAPKLIFALALEMSYTGPVANHSFLSLLLGKLLFFVTNVYSD